jgi:3-aminobutyryl-CoA ammonia-lyase
MMAGLGTDEGGEMEGLSVELRTRLSAADVHYGGNLVDGAHGLELFGDIVTELAVRTDGDEGLFAGYEKVEFLAPLYSGDFVRARGAIARMGTTSRTVDLEIWKEIAARPDVSASAADVLEEPVLATRARGTYVVRREQQRGPGGRGEAVSA